MIAVAPHHRYTLLVWAIVLSVPKAMREASLKDKTEYSSHTFYFIMVLQREHEEHIIKKT